MSGLTCCKQRRVGRKPVNANPGLKFNRIITFSFVQSFFTAFVLHILLSLKFKTQKQYTENLTAKHDETQRGLSVSTSKECGVAGPAFLTYFYVRLSGINVCKVIRVKIRRRSCQKSFLSPEVQIRIIWSA